MLYICRIKDNTNIPYVCMSLSKQLPQIGYWSVYLLPVLAATWITEELKTISEDDNKQHYPTSTHY